MPGHEDEPFSDREIAAFLDSQQPELDSDPAVQACITSVLETARAHDIVMPAEMSGTEVSEASLTRMSKDETYSPEAIGCARILLTIATGLYAESDRPSDKIRSTPPIDAAAKIAADPHLPDDQKIRWLDVLDTVRGRAHQMTDEEKLLRLATLKKEAPHRLVANALMPGIHESFIENLVGLLREKCGSHEDAPLIARQIVNYAVKVSSGRMALDAVEEKIKTTMSLAGTGLTIEEIRRLISHSATVYPRQPED